MTLRTSMACCNALVTLMVHLTTSSYHMALYLEMGSRRERRPWGWRSSGMRALKT